VFQFGFEFQEKLNNIKYKGLNIQIWDEFRNGILTGGEYPGDQYAFLEVPG